MDADPKGSSQRLMGLLDPKLFYPSLLVFAAIIGLRLPHLNNAALFCFNPEICACEF